jgi:hypothetical protein
MDQQMPRIRHSAGMQRIVDSSVVEGTGIAEEDGEDGVVGPNAASER